MLYNTFHNRWLRLAAALAGELIVALSVNLFIVPLGLYSGGILGVCQVIRTLLQTYLHLNFGTMDIAGILVFLANIPILFFAWKVLGRGTAIQTVICSAAVSFFYSIIPIPAVPIVDDYLTACLLGGFLNGVGGGIVLTCGCSDGGLFTIGLCMNKRGSTFTIGRFSLTFNAFLYAACLVLFNPETAIYSVIYNFFSSIMLDRMHKQTINVQALIFTKEDPQKMGSFVMETVNRTVTYWGGIGAYTGSETNVLCVCLSKYEIEELLHAVRSIDPDAFFTVQEGVRIYGNFQRRVG